MSEPIKSEKNKKQSAEQILKRISSESEQQKRKQALNILQRKEQALPKISWVDRWKALFPLIEERKQKFIRFTRMKQNRHIALISSFMFISTFLCWCVESKYDVLRKRARREKSFKQKQIEQQNDYIAKMLAKDEFQPVPIQDQIEDRSPYQFEKQDLGFDTRADLLEVLEEEKEMFEMTKQQAEEHTL